MAKSDDYVCRTIRFPRALYQALEKRKADLDAAMMPSSVTALVVSACVAAYVANANVNKCEVYHG